ncbi:hypothetical protein AK812_SmicGene41597 [Symbiodinium microadriaticum]|uniref:Uncharacterized protein n=1 Tax=Symbiodinium microadriaticum TaxID=2951 RepID=A0A1Q9C5P8_SYMMI|nr:hypothetical protein AK812_SmicGene41597 [Symbiodinium microadriaticum]
MSAFVVTKDKARVLDAANEAIAEAMANIQKEKSPSWELWTTFEMPTPVDHATVNERPGDETMDQEDIPPSDRAELLRRMARMTKQHARRFRSKSVAGRDPLPEDGAMMSYPYVYLLVDSARPAQGDYNRVRDVVFGRHRQYNLYTEPLTAAEQSWASQVEMAAYQDYTSAGHASTACNRQPIASLPSDSVCFSESYRAPDPSLPYGILHAAWVNSRTGLWGPRGSQDPELDAVPAQAERTIREIRALHEQMCQQNRLISTVALVTVLRYIMCDISQALEAADHTARMNQGDDSGAAPEPDEELLMQVYLNSEGRDTSDQRWARAMVRLQKELMGMAKAAQLTCIRRLQMGQPPREPTTPWGAQLDALLVAMASESSEVEGMTVVEPGWLEQWHQELSAFIPGFQLVTGVLEVESQETAGQGTCDITDREIEQLAADQEEERERKRQLAEDAEREQHAKQKSGTYNVKQKTIGSGRQAKYKQR